MDFWVLDFYDAFVAAYDAVHWYYCVYDLVWLGKTEDDVCSLECKHELLQQQAEAHAQVLCLSQILKVEH